MKNILHSLCHGRVPGWHKNSSGVAKTKTLTRKIENERLYFASIMSDEDFKRFKKLEHLHAERHSIKYMDTYINAFKMGAMFMFAVFVGEDEHDFEEF